MPNVLKPAKLFAGLFAAVALVIALTVPASADSVTFPNPVSPNGRDINTLYELIWIPAIIVFLFVEGWILLVIIRYRRGAHPPGYVPPQWHGNRLLEVAWTLIPLVIVLAIAGASFYVLQRDFVRPSAASASGPAAFQVTVVGYQFAWEYDYPQGFKTTGTLVVPTGETIELRTRTRDVIHSWWVPAITGKTDAVPGYDNYTWLRIDQPGKWQGQCAELCGAGHYTMITTVQAMSPSDFQAWVAKQQQSQSSSSSSSSAGGSGSSGSSSSSQTSSSGSSS